MVKVSIVVPVYNSELHIGKMIESVIDQTFSSWELLLIDDCSTDSSFSICEKWQNADKRIHSFHLSCNHGPSYARNYGIQRAIGQYLMFIDSDDFVAKEFIEKMYSYIEFYSADMIWCNYYEGVNDKYVFRSHKLPIKKSMSKKEMLALFYKDTVGLGSLWNKIYKLNNIKKNNILINERRVRAEDWEFNLDYISNSNNFVAIGEALYYYQRANNHSIMALYREQDFILLQESFFMLDEKKSEFDLEIDRNDFVNMYLQNVLNILLVLTRSTTKSKYKHFKGIVNSDFFSLLVKENAEVIHSGFLKFQYSLLKEKRFLLSYCVFLIRNFL